MFRYTKKLIINLSWIILFIYSFLHIFYSYFNFFFSVRFCCCCAINFPVVGQIKESESLQVKNSPLTSRFNPLCLFFRGAVDQEGTMGLQGHWEPG